MTKVCIYNKGNGDMFSPTTLTAARKRVKALEKKHPMENYGIVHAKKNKHYSVTPNKRKSRR